MKILISKEEKKIYILDILLIIILIGGSFYIAQSVMNSKSRLLENRNNQRERDIEFIVEKVKNIAEDETKKNEMLEALPSCGEQYVDIKDLQTDLLTDIPTNPNVTSKSGYEICKSFDGDLISIRSSIREGKVIEDIINL